MAIIQEDWKAGIGGGGKKAKCARLFPLCLGSAQSLIYTLMYKQCKYITETLMVLVWRDGISLCLIESRWPQRTGRKEYPVHGYRTSLLSLIHTVQVHYLVQWYLITPPYREICTLIRKDVNHHSKNTPKQKKYYQELKGDWFLFKWDPRMLKASF